MSPSPSPRLSRSYLQTVCAHSGCDVNASHSRDVVAPIHLATTYERSAPNPLQHPPTSTDPTIAPRGTDGGVCGYPGGYCYSRLANPTRNALERVLTDLDDGLASQAYASGMAAASAILSALAPGDHVIFGVDLYAGVKGVRGMLCDARNVKWDAANAASKEDIVRKIQPSTKLVWVESVGNPMCSVADVRGIRDAIQTLGMASPPLIVVDATWASQFVSRPLLHGADIVLHSLTKYIAGHSDCLGGALIRTRTSTPALDKMWTMACNACTIAGSALDPFTCYMVMRGIRSLWCRIKVQCANAMEVATWLSHHPRVSCVRYPGLSNDPGHVTLLQNGVSDSQDDDPDALFGGMLSFEVEGGAEAALRCLEACKLCVRATSLGGTETLLEHRRSVEAFAGHSDTPEGLVRMSVGLESVQDIINDLDQALNSI